MPTLLRSLAAACILWASGSALPAAAALIDLPATAILSGPVEYAIEIGDAQGVGLADASGLLSDGTATFSLDIFGTFAGGTAGDDPAADLFVFDETFAAILDGTLAMVEVDFASGTIAALFDLTVAGGAFAGATQALVILISPDFPASLIASGFAEIRRLDPVAAIPLPATLVLLITGIGALGALRRMSARRAS